MQDFENTKEGRQAQDKNRAGTVTFAYASSGRRVVDERDGLGIRHRFVGSRLVQTMVLGKFTTKYIAVDTTTTIVQRPCIPTERSTTTLTIAPEIY